MLNVLKLELQGKDKTMAKMIISGNAFRGEKKKKKKK